MVKRAEVIIDELTKSADRMKKVREAAEQEKEMLSQQETEPQNRNIQLTPRNPLTGGKS